MSRLKWIYCQISRSSPDTKPESLSLNNEMNLIWVQSFPSCRPENPNKFSCVNNLSNCLAFFSAPLNGRDEWRVHTAEETRSDKEVKSDKRWWYWEEEKSKEIKRRNERVSDEWWVYIRWGGKTDRARPTVVVRQNDRRMMGEERDTSHGGERWKWLQRERRKRCLTACVFCAWPRWPSGGRDDGHMNQRLSAWKMAPK